MTTIIVNFSQKYHKTMRKKTIKVTLQEVQDIVNIFMLCWIDNDGNKYPNLDKKLKKYITKYRNIRDKWVQTIINNENKNKQKR